MIIVGGVFAVFFILITIMLLTTDNALFSSKEYVKTEGIVVGNVEKYDYENERNMYTPVAEYEVDGEKYQVVSHGSSSIPTPGGKKVTIEYNPDNPKEAKFEGSKWIYFATFLLIFVFLGSGIGMVIVGIKKVIQINKEQNKYFEKLLEENDIN